MPKRCSPPRPTSPHFPPELTNHPQPPSASLKPTKIVKPNNFEAAGINRYAAESKEIQAKYKEKKDQEMLEEKTRGDDGSPFPLLEAPGRNDFETKRSNYPLSGNVFGRRDI